MDRNRQFTPAEIQQAQMAGVPADRDGLLGEYPKMMYRKGAPEPGTHNLAEDANGLTKPLPIQGVADIQTKIVANVDEELEAGEAGWEPTIERAQKTKAKAA